MEFYHALDLKMIKKKKGSTLRGENSGPVDKFYNGLKSQCCDCYQKTSHGVLSTLKINSMLISNFVGRA